MNTLVNSEPKTAVLQDEGTETVPNRSFAAGLNFYKLFWVFLISSIIGFVLETFWCYFTKGHFESRQGMIYGPFSQVYGFGGVLLVLALSKLSKRRDIVLFLGSALLGATFEYLCSWGQELVFSTVSWQYGHTQLNLSGRTNLMFALIWGVLGVLFIKDVYPWFSRLIERLPNRPWKAVTIVLAVLLCLDMLVSSAAVARQTERREGVAATNPVREFLDDHYDDAFLDRVYPNMVYID